MERGWEEEAIWRDLVGKERRWTLYIRRALKSHYDSRLRKGIYYEEKKVYEIIARLKEKEKRELKSFSEDEKKKNKWSRERWRDGMIQEVKNKLQVDNRKRIIVFSCYSIVFRQLGTSILLRRPLFSLVQKD